LLEGQTKKRTFMKVELIQNLREQNILVSSTYSKIKQSCDKKQIQTYETQAIIVPGWKGKQKGLMQSLWEWGWINKPTLIVELVKLS